MSVLDGYNKYKRYIKTNDGYKLCSQWTSSNTVQMDDGNTLQTNLGAINGITDSLTATSSNIAASAAAVKTLNDNLATLNSNLNTTKSNSITKVSGWTDPGSSSYKTGNYRGQWQSGGVQYSWLQIDGGTIQMQISISNGTHELNVRTKISSQEWSSISWTKV